MLDGTLERLSFDGANEAITNWQKDRGNLMRLDFLCLFLYKFLNEVGNLKSYLILLLIYFFAEENKSELQQTFDI